MYATLKAYPKLPTDGIGPVEYLPTKEEVKAPEKAKTLFNIDDLTDEQIIQMHSEKGLTLAHYKPTDHFEEESQLSDNQVVQEEVENEEVLHQSEEVVIHIETDQEYLERVAEIEGEPEIEVVEATENTFEYEVETVHYTDPAGNTFEAPVVSENFMDDFTEEEIAEVEFAKEAYEESIKLSNNDQVTDANIIALLEKEVSNIFGYDMTINVFVNGSEYNIVTNDGQEVTVPISYVNSLIS
jgi:hypothetical protein